MQSLVTYIVDLLRKKQEEEALNRGAAAPAARAPQTTPLPWVRGGRDLQIQRQLERYEK